jgi:exopolysaccharide production protein ExoQ
MPPLLALVLCVCVSVWLIRFHRKRELSVTPAAWIPTLFFLIVGSRPLGLWFHTGSVVNDGDFLEGSPLDRMFYLSLIIAAFVVLVNRGFSWRSFWAENKPLLCLYLYWVISTTWSDFPLIALKRVIKDFSVVVMVAVFCSEPDPLQSLKACAIRCASILLPASVLVIKYFPHLGRAYTRAGGQMITGVTTQKNSLGELVLFCSMFILAYLFQPSATSLWRRVRTEVHCVFLLMAGFWLLVMSSSKTSLLCCVMGGLLLCLKFLRKSRFLLRAVFVGILTVPILIFFAYSTFASFLEPVLNSIGRDATFTGRTTIWRAVLAQPINMLIGSGFYSFWMTDAGDAAWNMVGARASTCHNGFLETYLDGGLIGVFLIYNLLWFAGRKRSQDLQNESSRLQFTCLLIGAFHNNSEATFGRLSLIWFLIVFGSITGFAAKRSVVEESIPSVADDPETQIALA